eukprot:364974-Chlamydomonas_euryale.AAC.13
MIDVSPVCWSFHASAFTRDSTCDSSTCVHGDPLNLDVSPGNMRTCTVSITLLGMHEITIQGDTPTGTAGCATDSSTILGAVASTDTVYLEAGQTVQFSFTALETFGWFDIVVALYSDNLATGANVLADSRAVRGSQSLLETTIALDIASNGWYHLTSYIGSYDFNGDGSAGMIITFRRFQIV